MALIVPNAPIGLVSPDFSRAFRFFKRLPNEFAIWQRMSVTAEAAPHFYMRHSSGRAALIRVSDATTSQAKQAWQETFFQNQTPFGYADQQALLEFRQQLPAQLAQIPLLVLFPSIPAANLAHAQPKTLPDGMYWLSRDDLIPETFAAKLQEWCSSPFSQEEQETLRTIMTPEVVVPAAVTVRKPIERNTTAQLTDFLLSYNQEYILKLDLTLSDEGQPLRDDLNVSLVTGVAGGGKSLLLLYRARLLRQFFPQKKVLVLTHNRPLIQDLNARYCRLMPRDTAVEWRTFMMWCWHYWPQDEPWQKPLKTQSREELIRQVWHAKLVETAITARMLEDEIDWIKDQRIASREEYLTAERRGRLFGLNEAMRRQLYDAFEDYQQRLAKQNRTDWGGIAYRTWQMVQEGRIPSHQYDFILIDEAQFFAPVWFEVVKSILKPDGQLFMVADPTQGFLKRRLSWASSGLNVRGRAHRLETSYRTTREILDFASRFYQARLPGDEEAIVAQRFSQMPSGDAPVLIPVFSTQDEEARVVNEVRALHAKQVPLGHILLIHPDWHGVNSLINRLRKEFGEQAVIDPKEAPPGEQIRVCTLNAVTGLESPIVFVMGIHRLFEIEDSPDLSAEERAELRRDHTRQLYMSFTRAAQKLVISYVGNLPPSLQQLQAAPQAAASAILATPAVVAATPGS